ncbi:MAG: hypothetical protein RIE08_07870 [Acidimicrobiales bacterium]
MSDFPTDEAMLGACAAMAAALLGWAHIGIRRGLGLAWFVAIITVIGASRDLLDAQALRKAPDGVLAAGIIAFGLAVVFSVSLSWSRDVRARSIVLWAAGAVGVFVCVPDTEAIALVGSGLVVLALVSWLRAWPPVSSAAVIATAALVLAAAIVGARGRPPSMAGALGAVALAILAPVLETMVGRRRGRLHLGPVPAAVIVSVTAVVAGRVAGIGRGTSEATVLAVVIASVGLVAWLLALAVPVLRMPADQASARRRS